jgi:hypothetical protein
MKSWLAIVVSCLPVFGQAGYSGSGLYSSPGILASGSGCAAPNFCAYTGVDVVPWGTVPNLSSPTNGVQNNATVYDTSFLGHYNLDGITTFTNSAYLSPVTRVTDAVSAAGNTLPNFTAGIGGSAAFVLTSLSLTGGGWIRVDQTAKGRMCLFNQSAYPGHCQRSSAYTNTGGLNPASGIFLTANMCVGGSCSGGGLATKAYDFGQGSFSLTDSNTWFAFGGTDDIFGTAGATGVTPYTFSRAAGSVGIFSFGPPIADFQYGIPAGNNAPAWQTGTSYSYGAYVSHTLTSAEMLNGGVWATSLTVNVGDIIQAGSCIYKGFVAGVTASSGTGPLFPTSVCSNASYVDGTVTWHGTNSGPSFIYQDVTAGTHTSAGTSFQWMASPVTLTTIGSIASGSQTLTVASGTPFAASQVGQAISVSGADTAGATLYTTILAFNSATSVTLAEKALTTKTANSTVSLTGHPEMASSTVGDANGLIWMNVGPNYVPQQPGQIWAAIGGTSRDTLYPGASWPRYYGLGISTNTYGTGNQGYKANANQGSGIWATEYDAVANIYHLLNTITGIWTDWSCSGGTGYNCSGGSWVGTTVGSFVAITNPLGTGQACPFYIHNEKMSKNGLAALIVGQSNVYAACNSLNNFFLWKTTTSAYSSSMTTGSLQITYAGMNHWDIGTNKMVAFNSSAFAIGTCTFPCWTAGAFQTIYDLTGNVSSASDVTFGLSLKQLASQATPQSNPQGCYVTAGATIKNPDCNQSEILDFHVSSAGDPGTDTYPVCGTAYNDQGGPAFNAWQNFEACESTSPALTDASLPVTNGSMWQFTHSFCTQTSVSFSTQFCISEYSQDSNWLFWSSDWNCQNGSTTGLAPTVWTSGTYVSLLAIPAVPANPGSLCGLPWIPSNSGSPYVVGNLINPIENLSGSGAVDDVFQAIYVNGISGPASTLSGAQPICVIGGVNKSCFANTTAPASSTAGDTVCDNQNYNGTTQLNSINPVIPYSTSCPNGIVWQDLGPQTQRGDVFAVNLGHN